MPIAPTVGSPSLVETTYHRRCRNVEIVDLRLQVLSCSKEIHSVVLLVEVVELHLHYSKWGYLQTRLTMTDHDASFVQPRILLQPQ
jgi:hypothetical protein